MISRIVTIEPNLNKKYKKKIHFYCRLVKLHKKINLIAHFYGIACHFLFFFGSRKKKELTQNIFKQH